MSKLFWQGMEIIPDEKSDVSNFTSLQELAKAVKNPSSKILKMTSTQMILYKDLLMKPEELAKMIETKLAKMMI